MRKLFFPVQRFRQRIIFSSFTRSYSSSSKVVSQDYYDLIVIGGGSGGLACAKEAGSLGKRVAILDFVDPSVRGTKWGLGGTCVNVGCIPKKLYHQAASLGEALHDAEKYGWNIPNNINHKWDVLRNGVVSHIRSLNWGYRVQLKQKNVDYFNAKGRFINEHTIEMVTKTGKENLMAKNVVIAVGGRPKYPDNVPGATEYAITSDDIFHMEKPPGKTLVIGASYVALECAGFLTGLGFDTTLMVRSICLRGFDQQMARLVADDMAAKGTHFLWDSVPLHITKISGSEQLKVMWKNNKNETAEDVFDTVMFAIGRQAQTHTLCLDQVGVKINPDSFKVIGHGERSSIPHIYALGDVLHKTTYFLEYSCYLQMDIPRCEQQSCFRRNGFQITINSLNGKTRINTCSNQSWKVAGS